MCNRGAVALAFALQRAAHARALFRVTTKPRADITEWAGEPC